MNKELHQRINEAAVDITVDIINRNPQPIYFVAIKEAAFRGAKFGYKEAIKMAKEWLLKQGRDWWEGYGLPFCLDDFETEMNKLWEETNDYDE